LIRLDHALAHCDLYIDTDGRTPAEVLHLVQCGLSMAGDRPGDPVGFA
jgi:hypothetical protein